MVNPGNVTPGRTRLVLPCEDLVVHRHPRKRQQRLHGSCPVKSRDAAQHMARLPPAFMDDTGLLSKIELLALGSRTQEADFAYKLPQMMAELLRLRAPHTQARWSPAAAMSGGGSPIGDSMPLLIVLNVHVVPTNPHSQNLRNPTGTL